MKKTFKEKFISRCTGWIQKNRWLKAPVIAYMAVVLFVYHAGLYMAANGKRYSCAVLVLLFSVLSSSFTYPGGYKGQDAVPEKDGVLLAAEQEINTEELAFIDTEADDIGFYDDVVLLSEAEIDTYTLDEILAENADYQGFVQQSAGTSEGQDYADYEFDENDWRLILVNKQHSIPDGYEFPLGTITGSMRCDERILEDLLAMMQAAKADGVDLVICSPYRDFNRQTYLFNRRVNLYIAAGMSYMDAYKTVALTTTAPNASEHQIGLAIDFYSSTYMQLDEGFEKTEAGKWLAEHSCEYGFILRYPRGKEYITGIDYEPWHFRYVGVEAATVITNQGITLEEFWEDL